MNTDTWRLHYTYGIAIVVLVGAGLMLFIPTPDITGEAKLAFVTFVAGIVLGFVFNRESAVGAARASERAHDAGAAAAAPSGTAHPNSLEGGDGPAPLP
jgi:hypothetical protein